MSWGAFGWGEDVWAGDGSSQEEIPGPEGPQYNFGAFVDRREDRWPEWDPSRVHPPLAA